MGVVIDTQIVAQYMVGVTRLYCSSIQFRNNAGWKGQTSLDKLSDLLVTAASGFKLKISA